MLQGADPADDVFRPRFEAVFDVHHADVLAFARRRVEGDTAEDVVSETFAVVWRKRDTIPDAPLPWIYAIARRVVANQRRSAKRRIRLLNRLSSEPGDGAGDRDPAEVVALRERVAAAFSSLSESEREILMLVAWDGVDAKAAARILGCSAAAFRVRLHRARRALERGLEGDRLLVDSERAAQSSINPAEEAR